MYGTVFVSLVGAVSRMAVFALSCRAGFMSLKVFSGAGMLRALAGRVVKGIVGASK